MVMTDKSDYMLSFDFDYDNKPENKPMVIVPFSSKQDEWNTLQGIDIRNKFRNGKHKHYRLDSILPCTYGGMIEQYIRHPEAKSLGPDGKPCTAETRGLLQRAHITAGEIRYIDKETSSLWNHGDDLSVLPDSDIGFKIVEYGRGRKVRLPDSIKDEMLVIGIRELMRRGIGQHTIENALHSTIRIKSYRKLQSAIEAYKQERTHPKDNAQAASKRAAPDGNGRGRTIRLVTRGNLKYVVSQNYVWEVSEAQYAKIIDEIKTKGRLGSLNDYGKYLGRIAAQSLEVRSVAVDLGSPRKPHSACLSRVSRSS